jgi:hypothetical protein
MNTKRGVREPIGSANTQAGSTAFEDVCKAIAPVARFQASEIPDDVQIVGLNVSFKQAADAMTAISRKKIEHHEIELSSLKAKTTERTEEDPADFILFDL